MSAMDPSAASRPAREVERQLVVFSMHCADYAPPITCVRGMIRYA